MPQPKYSVITGFAVKVSTLRSDLLDAIEFQKLERNISVHFGMPENISGHWPACVGSLWAGRSLARSASGGHL